MKTTPPFSASILVALALGAGPTAQAEGGHHGGGHHGGGHHGGGHHGGGHHGGGHHGGGHYYGHSRPAFHIHSGFGYLPYGYRSTIYRGPVPYYRAAGSLASQVQVALARCGYYHGAIDGIIGSGSRRALRNFQNANGLPVTGRIDSPTISALRYY